MAEPVPACGPLPAGFLPVPGGGAADWSQEVLGHPAALRWCAQPLQLCRLARRYDGLVPAPGGRFPQWELTSDGNGFHRGALRVLGRVRRPTACEEGFEAVAELCFRGTRNIDNWLTNLRCGLDRCGVGAGSGRVHTGFAAAYVQLQGEVVRWLTRALGEELSPRVLVVATGHSLGGALATLAAYDLAWRGGSAVCVTWGSPRVGDAEFAESFRAVVPRCLRFVNKFDPVPRLPPDDSDPVGSDADLMHRGVARLLRRPQAALQAVGYRHVCEATQLDDELASSAAHWANAAAAALERYAHVQERERRADIQEIFPHTIPSYEKNLGSLLDGCGGARRGLRFLGAAVTASATAASVLSAMRARRESRQKPRQGFKSRL